MAKKIAKSKGSYRHGNLREAILLASQTIVAQIGADHLSIREAARVAGVTHQAPYRHFADREALIAALAARGFEELGKSLINNKQVSESSSSGLENLRSLGAGYARWANQNVNLFRLMFSSAVPDYDSVPELKSATDRLLELVTNAVKQCQSEGILPAGETRSLARKFWAAVHGVSLLHADRQFKPLQNMPRASENLAIEMVSNLIEGLRPKA